MFKSFTKSIACFFVLLCIFSSSTVYAWKMEENFDNQPLGEKPKYSGNGGIEWFSGTKVTDSQAYGSGRSAALTVTKGSSGWGEFGAIINYPSTIKENGEVWWRVRTFMPDSYNYASDTFALKFMRTHTRDVTTKNNLGYLDLYVEPNGNFLYQIEIGHEVSTDTWWAQINESMNKQSNAELAAIDSSVNTGRWETYEIYVNFARPTGVYRVWKDGKLVYENTKWETVHAKSGGTDSESDLMALFTYWNGNAPQTQTMYIDDLVVTTDTPAAQDSFGNSYIGMGTFSPTSGAAPKPPNVFLNN